MEITDSFTEFIEVPQEIVLKGIGVAPGIVMGPAIVYTRDDFVAEQRKLAQDEIAEELQRFEMAVRRSEKELKKIAAVGKSKIGEESAAIFEAQLLMLRDDSVYAEVTERIEKKCQNAEYSVEKIMTRHRNMMAASGSEYLRERANDLFDVQQRLIRNLQSRRVVSKIEENSIVIAKNLTAADIILFSRRNIKGCALSFGGPTSHVSIMARALSVPTIVSLQKATENVVSGNQVIVDGYTGKLIINPTEKRRQEYQLRIEKHRRLMQAQDQLVPLPAITLDQRVISLRANLEFEEEAGLIKKFGADGIGLMRTEMLFLASGNSLDEEAQFNVYRNMIDASHPYSATFRLLDLGGDKVMPLAHREQNPFLGWRGIRILEDRHELLRPQVRAILRASAFGPARMMLPMVTNLSEVRNFQIFLKKVKAELDAEGVHYNSDIPVGIMVEVPAVAIRASQFASEVDFFSIGTNDLTQYTLAVDRGNDLVANIYDELNPAVLQLIKSTLDAGRDAGIRVSLCGEMAGDPFNAPILLGLGLQDFSATPACLSSVKAVIRALRYSEAVKMANEACQAIDANEVRQLLNNWFKQNNEGLASLLPSHELNETD